MKFTLVAALIAASFSLLLGIFALIKNYKGSASKNFALFNFALAIWNVSEVAASIHDHQVALCVYRLSFIGASFLPYYAATFLWSVANCRSRRVENVLISLAAIFAILSPTSLIIKDITIDLTQLTPIEEVQGLFYYLFILFFVSVLLYSLLPVFLVYRRSTGYVRNQLRYIMAAVCIGLLGTLNYVVSQVYDKMPPLYCFVQMGLCATFAAAILKHRLMDITVIIRKTLVYSGVMTILALAYLAIVTIFASIFEGLTGYQTVFSSTTAAILITVCFQPLRKRIQTFVDVRFFRQYVDREEKLYELSRDVITHTTPEAMAQALMRVLGESFHPKLSAIYLRQRDGSSFVLAAAQGGANFPQIMSEENVLVQYLSEHPQPFIEDANGATAEPQNTRDIIHKERPAA